MEARFIDKFLISLATLVYSIYVCLITIYMLLIINT